MSMHIQFVKHLSNLLILIKIRIKGPQHNHMSTADGIFHGIPPITLSIIRTNKQLVYAPEPYFLKYATVSVRMQHPSTVPPPDCLASTVVLEKYLS
jgi:hypothetical protein